MTHDPAALRIDEEYCRAQAWFGQRIGNSGFALGRVVGGPVGDTAPGIRGSARATRRIYRP